MRRPGPWSAGSAPASRTARATPTRTAGALRDPGADGDHQRALMSPAPDASVASVPSTVRCGRGAARGHRRRGLAASPDSASRWPPRPGATAAACSSSMPGAAASRAQSRPTGRRPRCAPTRPGCRSRTGTAAGGQPGTMSNSTPAAATAMASWTTGSAVSTSPATSRVTRRPDRGPRPPGPWRPRRARRRPAGPRRRRRPRRGSPGHVGVGDHQRRGGQRLAARTVSRPGSPGPVPTNSIRPGVTGWCSVHLGTLISGAGSPAIRSTAAGSARSSSSAASASPNFSASLQIRGGRGPQECAVGGAEHRPQRQPVDPRGRRRRGWRRHRPARRPGRCSPLPGGREAPVPRWPRRG